MAAHSNILSWRIPKDRGVWQATVHRVAKNQTRLQQLSTHTTETFLLVTTWVGVGGRCYWHLWVETRDAVKHPTVLRTASPCPPQEDLPLHRNPNLQKYPKNSNKRGKYNIVKFKNKIKFKKIKIKGEMVIDATVEKITQNYNLTLCVYVCVCSVMSNFLQTPWTQAQQTPLSMEFSRQEYWSGLLCPLPGDLPDPGIKLQSPASPALAGGFFTTVLPGKPII